MFVTMSNILPTEPLSSTFHTFPLPGADVIFLAQKIYTYIKSPASTETRNVVNDSIY